jgi:hypothetical protein
VTASAGTRDGSTPSRLAMMSLRSLMVATRSSLKPPLFDAPEVDGSAGPSTSGEPSPLRSLATADGRVWNHGSWFGSFATGSMPIRTRSPANVCFTSEFMVIRFQG